MSIISSLAELGNYVAFSLLAGYVALQFVPESKKPKIVLAQKFLLLCTLFIIVFTFVPVIQVILFFRGNVGFAEAATTVLFSFQVGHVWLFTTIFSIFLWLSIYLERSKYLQAFWIFLMVVAVGYGSHVSSQSFVVGLFSHTTHFLMVVIWVGVLLHVAWFSKDRENWPDFLMWFTPLAIICMVNIFATGFVILSTIENPKDYLNGWASPYGRMLLLKHLSIIPVIAFAVINGILVKKVKSKASFEPRIWLKAESLILMFVFYFTGILGTISPPYENHTTDFTPVAPTWMEWILGKDLTGLIKIEFVPTLLSLFLMMVSVLFLALIIISFKFKSPVFAILFAGSFIFTLYLGLMFSCILYPLGGTVELSVVPFLCLLSYILNENTN
nr:CopD family protein [Neobacillus sp. Marseille-Q6967]